MSSDLNLTSAQDNLLKQFVEAQERLPPERQRDFIYRPSISRRTHGVSRQAIYEIFDSGQSTIIDGKHYTNRNQIPKEYDTDTVVHEGLEGGVVDVSQGDIDALVDQELIRFRAQEKTQSSFYVTAKGNARTQQSPLPEEALIAPGLALVLKGGGVKGLALVGALLEMEKYYSYSAFVGTSAGAIVAGLLAAGCTPKELETILRQTDFTTFQDAHWYQWLKNLVFHLYVYPGKKFEEWLWKQVQTYNRTNWKLQPPQLKDLKTRLTIYAAQEDVGALILDSEAIDGNRNLDLTFAVRCSMSIPGFFRPPMHNGRPVFDGGLLNNFPARDWISKNPHYDFVGIYLGEKVINPAGSTRLPGQLLGLITNRDDAQFIDEHRDRVIVVDPDPVGTTDFDLSTEEIDFLVLQGRADALEHMHHFLPEGARPSDAEVAARRDEAEQAKAKAIVARKRRIKLKRIRRFAVAVLVAMALVLGLYFLGPPLLRMVAGRYYYERLYSQAESLQQKTDKTSIEKEIDLYRRLIVVNYKPVSIHDNMGSAFERLADLDNCEENRRQAIQHYSAAINIAQLGTTPDDPQSTIGAIYLNRGLAFARSGKLAEARDDLQKVLTLKASGDQGVTDDKYHDAKTNLQWVEDSISRGIVNVPCGQLPE